MSYETDYRATFAAKWEYSETVYCKGLLNDKIHFSTSLTLERFYSSLVKGLCHFYQIIHRISRGSSLRLKAEISCFIHQYLEKRNVKSLKKSLQGKYHFSNSCQGRFNGDPDPHFVASHLLTISNLVPSVQYQKIPSRPGDKWEKCNKVNKWQKFHRGDKFQLGDKR